MSELYGIQTFTSDGPVDTADQRVKVNLVVATSGATAGLAIIRHGGLATSQEVGRLNPAINQSSSLIMGDATFPSGCFIDIDANITQATVWYTRY